MKVHTVAIDEAHRLESDKSRNDIGSSALVTLFATGAKRGIQLVLSNQLLSRTPPGVFGNLGCRIITRLVNPKCIWLAQQSMGLSQAHARRITRLKKREVLVAYGGNPTPFLVKVKELWFPPKPDEMSLEKNAQDFLAEVTWSEDSGQMSEPTDPQAVAGDALKVFIRIAEKAETIDERCEALRMDRTRETRARKVLIAKGYIAEDETTFGNKYKIYGITSKGTAAAKKMGIKVKHFKSGRVHEYLLNQVEKKIGSLNSQYKFQRSSEIAREYGIQPDSVLNMTSGYRAIIEIVCNNVDREAQVLTKERTIPGVDMVLVITANKKLKKALEDALKDNLYEKRGDSVPARLVVLDAGECLGERFDWIAVFEGP